MKAFVSLHTAKPDYQLHNEVFYLGYKRVEIEFDPENVFGISIDARFPVIEEDSPDVTTYAAIGSAREGQGEIFMRVSILPHIPLVKNQERMTEEYWRKAGAAEADIPQIIKNHGATFPRVCFLNSDEGALPDTLNPIARVAHKLVYSGLIEPRDLHPKLFEAINDALHNAGVPILKVIREGAGEMKGKWADMPSLSEMMH